MHDVLRILSTPRRQELLRLCWDQERSAGDLHRALPDVTFGAVSQQLQKLSAAGALTVRRAGRHRYYKARKDVLGPLQALLETMWADALWQLKLRAELLAGKRGPRRRGRTGTPSRSARRRTPG